MTLEQFLEKLEQTPRDWYRVEGCIRRGPNEWMNRSCPVSSLTGATAAHAMVIADELGIERKEAIRIIDAADNWPDYDADLRAKLLKATGLA